MKLLYLGVFRDGTGWGEMAINTMMALIETGVEVTARAVKLNNSHNVDLPIQILEAEQKRGGTFDVVIENLLPHSLDYCGKIPQNIAYYCTETSHFRGTNWASRINCMNSAWICNQQGVDASLRSGVKIPIHVVPIACDITKYQRSYQPLSIRDKLGDSFIFYFIGDFNKRKNISALIKAFHLEFDVNEPVNLVIKTSIGELDNILAREVVISEINRIKESMKLYRSVEQYKQEIFLVGKYTNEEIMRLHASCDCFVCPSYGEAFCIPAFDSMAMGKTPIIPAHTGFLEYMSENYGWLVKSYPEPVYAMHKSDFKEMYNSRETWWGVDIHDLMRCMRSAYENSNVRQAKAMDGRRRAYDFSYQKVGKLMQGILNEKT